MAILALAVSCLFFSRPSRLDPHAEEHLMLLGALPADADSLGDPLPIMETEQAEDAHTPGCACMNEPAFMVVAPTAAGLPKSI